MKKQERKPIICYFLEDKKPQKYSKENKEENLVFEWEWK